MQEIAMALNFLSPSPTPFHTHTTNNLLLSPCVSFSLLSPPSTLPLSLPPSFLRTEISTFSMFRLALTTTTRARFASSIASATRPHRSSPFSTLASFSSSFSSFTSPLNHHHHKTHQPTTTTSRNSTLSSHTITNRPQLARFGTSAQMTPEEKAALRDSSTLIIVAPISKSKVQPGKANYKLLLLQRSRVGTSASAHVFPGGNVDKADHDPRWATLLNYKPKSPNDPPLHNAICAIREAFEESGVLVCDPPTELSNDEIRIWREKVHNDGKEFYNLCTSHNLKPSVDRLTHFSSWITPPIEPKRFHTQFYLTVLPWSRDSFSDSRVFADGKETTRLDWFTPEEALEAYRKQSIQTFMPPQFVSIAHLLPFKKHEDLQQHFGTREIMTIMPEFQMVSQDDDGLHLIGVLPGDEEHSVDIRKGHRHRVHITKNKKGMNVKSYIHGPTEIKARL